jgi:hypothetical protein
MHSVWSARSLNISGCAQNIATVIEEISISPSDNNAKMGDTSKELFLSIAYAALFSIYTAILLAATDIVLHKYLPDYQYSGRYEFGVILFFFATTGFIFLGRWRGWNNWRYFIVGPLGVFLPLVFLASAVRLYIGGEGSMIQAYAQSYCHGSAEGAICGKAFAANVLTMSLRALPTVVTAPALYWYLFFHRVGNKQESVK